MHQPCTGLPGVACIGPPSRADQEQVLAYVYQKLVRYEERTVRFAVRLDKSEFDENSDFVRSYAHLRVTAAVTRSL
jgi:hypothetical protein